jgi:uncharacterized membrane protein YeiH
MLRLIEFGAVVSFGIFGILLARKNRLDFVGLFTVAFISAFAGGTLRDLFLDRHPLFWIANDHYALVVFLLALASTLIPSKQTRLEGWLLGPDALGLGLFAIVGANYALESGTSLFIASLMGVVTGTAGGAICDVICNEVPRLFKATPLYATCAFVGCWSCFGIQHLFGRQDIALITGIVVVVVMRLAAVHWKICLPEHRTSE